MGYSIVNLSFFDFAGETKFYKFPEFNNDLFGHLERMLSGTILNIFIAYKNYDLYETNIKIFQTVEKEASKQRIKPKFIYAHIMSPHTPFLMNEKGEKLSRFETGNNKEAYLRQLKGVNVLVLETIKTILKTSNEPPIIIIQGDHGFREIKGENHDDEAYSVFSAYLLPIDEQRKISADMAPYNSFTRVLNLYESAKNK